MSTDAKQMTTLLQKMTTNTPPPAPIWTPAQLAIFMESVMPKVCTETPGFPAGMTCETEFDEDGNGWHFHVRRLAP